MRVARRLALLGFALILLLAFAAGAVAKNTDGSGTVTLGPTLGTFLAAGTISVSDNPYFYRQPTFGSSEEIGKSGKFECGESPGSGTYGVRVFTTSRVAVEDVEPLASHVTVVVERDVECV